MRVVRTHDPEVMRIDDDSILSRMIGFVVILVGVSVWPIYLNAESEPGKDPGIWGLLLVLGGGLVCALVGLSMMLFAGQTIIDRRLGKVLHWQRFLWWRRRPSTNSKSFIEWPLCDRAAVTSLGASNCKAIRRIRREPSCAGWG